MSIKKILVIGLDAACLNNIMPWINEGHLPSLKHLMDIGIYSDLRTVMPAMTASAWTSMVTGKNPGKHGVFDFYRYNDNNYGRQTVSSLDNKARCIWDYYSEHARFPIVINVPVTHPAKKIKGIIIPGFPAPENPNCFPSDILQEFEESHGKYRLYSPSDMEFTTLERKLRGYIDLSQIRKNIALYFGQKYDWDFFMVQFQTTDTAFHCLRKPKYILPLYQYIDKCVGEIVAALGNDVNIFIVSDHGIGKTKWKFCLNSWLRKEGFLSDMRVGLKEVHFSDVKVGNPKAESRYIATVVGKVLEYLGRLGITIEEIDRIVFILKLSFLKKLVPQYLKNKILRRQIDWGRTKAYCPSSSSMSVRINLKDRESSGVVKMEEYHALRQSLINKLQALTGPDGTPVFEAVLPREAYYKGRYLSQAPDIVLFARQMDYLLSADILSRIVSPFNAYMHKMNGLFIAAGPDINCKGYLNSKLSLLDVAPTILHMSGLPVPEDMDGRVLTEIFREDSDPAQRKVIYQRADYVKERIRGKVNNLKKLNRI